jgi:peptidoglycan/xylan/chitin deacetylase (PgdA/CDA1 family)
LFIRQHKYAALILALSLMAGAVPSAHAEHITADKSAVVIFAYQRVGEDAMPHSSISVDRFRSHIEELKTEGYSVMPLPDVITALRARKPLPVKTVAITLDGAWASTFTNAIPVLTAAKLPFTVFYSADMADGATPSHVGWDTLKELSKNKLATIGILPSAYAHLTQMNIDSALALVNKAVSRHREQFGAPPAFFAYPYGEYSPQIQKRLSSYDFAAAFGQHSGVAHAGSDFTAVPRFTMTDAYGDLDRFLLTANALPLPVTDIVPDDMNVAIDPTGAEPLMVGFTVTPELKDLSRLSCFVSGAGKAELTRLGNRIEMRLPTPFDDYSTRINCTMPDSTVIPGQPQNWRWFGMQLIDKNHEPDNTTTE